MPGLTRHPVGKKQSMNGAAVFLDRHAGLDPASSRKKTINEWHSCIS